MRAVITVVGKDMVGILAKVAGVCVQMDANVIEVNQSVLQDLFAMVMLVDISRLKGDFGGFSAAIKQAGQEMGLSAHVMHEDLFNSMHRI